MRSVEFSVKFRKSYDRLLKQFSKKKLSKKTDPYSLSSEGVYAETKADLLSNRFRAVMLALSANSSVDSFFKPHPLKGQSVETWDFHLFPDIVLLVEITKANSNEEKLLVKDIGTHRQVKLESALAFIDESYMYDMEELLE